jgi:hypothetical protein
MGQFTEISQKNRARNLAMGCKVSMKRGSKNAKDQSPNTGEIPNQNRQKATKVH